MTGATADILITRDQVERWRGERADLLQRITRLDRRLALVAEIVSEIAAEAPAVENRPGLSAASPAPITSPVTALAVVHPMPAAAAPTPMPSVASTLEQALGMDVGLISAGVVAMSDPGPVSHFRTLQPAAAAVG
jgi:hypothetical protein